ncbi:MAG: hypothetical protein R3A52_03945 [Polyangiales bacterium]
MRSLPRSLVALSLGLAAPAALAQNAPCFRPTAANARPSTHTTAGPGARFEPSPECRYAVRARGASAPAPTQQLSPEARDVAEFFRDLGAPSGRLAADLEVVAARGEATETLSLRPCVTRLGEGSTVLRFEPQTRGNTVRVRSTADAARCPVADAEVVLVPDGGEGTVLREAPSTARTLSLTAAASTDIPGDGSPWSVYLRRHGSPVAVRADVLRFGDPRTALQRRFATPGDAQWFTADFSHGALRLTPTAMGARDLTWAELVTAAATQAVFLAGPDGADGAPAYALPVDPGGDAIEVPDVVVREAMRARYGAVGEALVPARVDWARVLGSLRLCHRGSYAPEPVRGARVLPTEVSAMSCLPLAQVASAPQATSLGALSLERRMDLLQRRDDVSVAQSSTSEREEIPLDADARVRFATPGDTLHAPASLPDGRVLALCRVAGEHDAIALRAGERHEFTEAEAGLWQLVARPDGEARCTSQDLALARVAVIAPRTDWVPLGLHEHGAMDMRAPWRALETSGDDTFAFHARSGLPEWRLSTTPDVAAAVNGAVAASSEGADESPRVNRSVPVRLRAEAPVNAPPSALVVLLAEGESCPASELDLVPNLRALPSESTLHAFLATENPAGAPRRFTCLARARLRVTPPLIHRGSTPGPFFARWGLPGSVSLRAHYEVVGTCDGGDCLSLGAAAPLIYGRLSLTKLPWMTLEFSLPLVLAASPGDGRALHTGLGLDVGISFGPRILPRFVTVGLLFQPTFLAVGTERGDEAVNLAPYLGVNLSSVLDAIRSE